MVRYFWAATQMCRSMSCLCGRGTGERAGGVRRQRRLERFILRVQRSGWSRPPLAVGAGRWPSRGADPRGKGLEALDGGCRVRVASRSAARPVVMASALVWAVTVLVFMNSIATCRMVRLHCSSRRTGWRGLRPWLPTSRVRTSAKKSALRASHSGILKREPRSSC